MCWAVIPKLSELTLKIMETKKTWEYVSTRAYPKDQAFALPLCEDKQRQACPRQRWYINTPRRRISQGNDNVNDNLNLNDNDKGNGYANDNHSIYAKTVHPQNGVHLIIYIKGKLAAGRYKINPRERFLLHHRCIKIQICEVWLAQTVTFRKRPFETGRTTALRSRSIDVLLCPPTRGQAGIHTVIA